MAIMRIDPTRGLETISKKMNDLLTDFNKDITFEYGGFAPKIDIFEDDKKVYVEAELPGIKKEEVKVKINSDGVLNISGEKKRCDKCCTDENEKKEIEVIRIERTFGAFHRAFQLPENISQSSIKAKFENGVLRICLDKVEPEKTQDLQVTIE